MVDYNDILCKCFLFRGMEGLPAGVADGAEHVSYAAGEDIFPAGRQGRCMGVIARGKAEVLRKPLNAAGGGQIVMSILGEGGEFGAAGLYSGFDYFVTDIIAAAPTEVIYLDKQLIDLLMITTPAIARNYIAYLSERIYFLNGRIDGFTSGSVERGLAIYILGNMNGADELVLPCSLSRLAAMLHVGRASLYRAMDKLTQKGIIKRNNRCIRVIDKDGLKSL